jgi:hypothetical protein
LIHTLNGNPFPEFLKSPFVEVEKIRDDLQKELDRLDEIDEPKGSPIPVPIQQQAIITKPEAERTVPLPIRDIQKLTGFGETKFRQMMEAGELGLKKIKGTRTVTLLQSEYEKLKANMEKPR